MTTLKVEWTYIEERAKRIAETISISHAGTVLLYGIPRGGTYAALAVSKYLNSKLVDTPERADIFIDDIIDSGVTKQKYNSKPFFALYDKKRDALDNWLVFPWEQDEQSGPEENIRRLLEYIGEDPNREGLKETPKRVIKSYDKLFGGYKQKPEDILKVFTEGACDEMVVLRGIEVYSMCEHHMLPFYGKAHIAYVPNKRVVGISKLARLLEIYSRRLQIQERLCQEITAALDIVLNPKGSACIIEAQHMCMTSRGVEKQNSSMITSSLTGIFRTDGRARSEFMDIIKN